jgi:hypothetical protein
MHKTLKHALVCALSLVLLLAAFPLLPASAGAGDGLTLTLSATPNSNVGSNITYTVTLHNNDAVAIPIYAIDFEIIIPATVEYTGYPPDFWDSSFLDAQAVANNTGWHGGDYGKISGSDNYALSLIGVNESTTWAIQPGASQVLGSFTCKAKTAGSVNLTISNGATDKPSLLQYVSNSSYNPYTGTLNVTSTATTDVAARALGDVDGNGVIDNTDVQRLYQYSQGRRTLEEADILAGDVDRSGEIDNTDVQRLYQYTQGRRATL